MEACGSRLQSPPLCARHTPSPLRDSVSLSEGGGRRTSPGAYVRREPEPPPLCMQTLLQDTLDWVTPAKQPSVTAHGAQRRARVPQARAASARAQPVCLDARGPPRRPRRPRSCWARPVPPLSPAASAPAFRSQCDRHLLSPGCAALPGPATSSCDKVPQPAAATDIPGLGPPRPLGSRGSLRRPRPTSLAPVCPTPSRGPAASEPCTCRSPRSTRGPVSVPPVPRASPHPPGHPARSGHPQTLLYCLS